MKRSIAVKFFENGRAFWKNPIKIPVWEFTCRETIPQQILY